MRFITPLLLCCLLAACSAAKAPVTDDKELWGKTIDSAEQSFKKGDYGKAEELAREAIGIAEKNKLDYASAAVSYNDLSVFLLRQQKFDEAEKFAVRSLETYEEAKDEKGIALASTNLANVKHHKNEYAEAEKLERRALEIREKTDGKDSLETAVCLSNLGNILMMQKRYEEARPLLDRALSIAEAKPAPTDAATIKACIGSLLRKEKKLSESEKVFKEAIAMHEKAVGPDHPLVADDLFAYAKCLDKMDRASDATEVRSRAETIRKAHGIPLPTAEELSHE